MIAKGVSDEGQAFADAHAGATPFDLPLHSLCPAK